MTFAEMTEFIEGHEARRREEWERTRYMIHAVYQSQCSRELDRHEVLTFPWDNLPSEQTSSEDARTALIQQAKEMEEFLHQNEVNYG